MYKEYQPTVLKRLQQVELLMLEDFIKLCARHQIDYFLIGGSLLGAVRHQGFIPWDDDIDIGMTREHYEHFLKVARQEASGSYGVINVEMEPAFPGMFTKWYKKGTQFRDQDAVTTGYKAGIALDIFCFDNIWDHPRQLRRQAMKAWIFSKLMILCRISRPTILTEGIAGKAALGISLAVHQLLKLLRVSPRWLYEKAEQAARSAETKATLRTAYLFDQTPYSNVMKKTDLYPTQEMKFEHLLVQVPRHPEAYLKVQYGAGYMTPPPVSRRHNHPPVHLDFGGGKERNV